jgi:hypothetical protein
MQNNKRSIFSQALERVMKDEVLLVSGCHERECKKEWNSFDDCVEMLSYLNEHKECECIGKWKPCEVDEKILFWMAASECNGWNEEFANWLKSKVSPVAIEAVKNRIKRTILENG